MENQPPSNPSMSKPLAWIVLIVIVLILAVGGYFLIKQGSTNSNGNYSSTTNGTNQIGNVNSVLSSTINLNSNIDTTGWKSFEDSTLGIRLNYPATYVELAAGQGSSTPSVRFADQKYVNSEVEYPIITITKNQLTPYSSLSDWVDHRAGETGYSQTKSTASTGSGLSGLTYRTSSISDEMAIQKGGIVYEISIVHYGRLDTLTIGEGIIKSLTLL